MSIVRIAVNFGVPLLLAGVFWALIATSEAHGVAVWVALAAFAIVLAIWLGVRDLATHATASRLVHAGQPDELLALANREIEWRLTARGKDPFRIYRAWAHVLKGAWSEAERALDEHGVPSRAAWAVQWESAKITSLIERATAPGGDADALAEARRLFDYRLAAVVRRAGGTARLVADDAEAKVRFAEGDPAGARTIFEKLCRDVRLGPASRGMAHWYAGRCALATGDRAAADRHLVEAAQLAPRTFVAAAATALRASAGAAAKT